jgi:L1 cell adhesion molecule like protein
LSKEEIERMATDAGKYKEEDEKQKDRIAAKNSLASYSYSMKSKFASKAIFNSILYNIKSYAKLNMLTMES